MREWRSAFKAESLTTGQPNSPTMPGALEESQALWRNGLKIFDSEDDIACRLYIAFFARPKVLAYLHPQ